MTRVALLVGAVLAACGGRPASGVRPGGEPIEDPAGARHPAEAAAREAPAGRPVRQGTIARAEIGRAHV